jgi:hypothetical protein
MLIADRFFQIRHLNRSQRRFESFVAHLQARAINRLLQRVTGEDSECMRHSGFLGGLPNAARNFVDNDIVVGSISSQ